MPARYRAKQRLTTRDLKQIVQASSPVIDDMTELLLGAKDRAAAGELQVLKPWLLAHTWSPYTRRSCISSVAGNDFGAGTDATVVPAVARA